jgi:ATPase subunit of ABC transporter with duplicated ATPase domains
MIQLKNLSMHYGPKLLFDEVTLLLNNKRRYAIVGANGTGKSTLLRLMAGQETSSLGEIESPKGKVVGWLKQDHYLYENDRIIDVVLKGKPKLWKALEDKEKLLQEEWTDKSGYTLCHLEETIANQDGYRAESFAHILLNGLGIADKDHEKPLSTLSGGYKLRVLLAQALFEEPEILLLDEPTNHLDIMTISWLEKYLTNDFQGMLVFISHDISFLNNVSTDILDIDYGEIRAYKGSYKHFLGEKKLVMEQKLKEKKHVEDKIAHLQSFVDKFKYKASKSRQAMSRAKMIDKMEVPDIKKSSRIEPNFKFDPLRPSGKQVLTVKEIYKSFGDKDVLENINFEVGRGEKIAIIGHNGIGKSTLLKVIQQLVPADLGESEWGYAANIAYFAQDHHEAFKDKCTVMEFLAKNNPKSPEKVLRSVLGQVLFTEDDVEKDVLTISGGEATRLLLANTMLTKPNILILDEPTNHLDVESIDGLAKALRSYTGTLIMVSHDRFFVSKIANRILSFTENGMKDYKGSYAAYLKYYGDDYLSQAFLKTKK